ncbi:MAG: tRNA preQ1(34) S-adenosylmethionine ribosyltransferase-isomerase QueA [Gammaproteobacteria bacterium]|nr:tRNA preQ1(34) S-adenosylmethionine ribosyltransferase-isomerase QueA [Gammaproteobacteria bacterium]
MQKSDFAYALPRELIAQAPLPERDGSRLMHLGADGPEHRQFGDLPGLLAPGDLLVVNDTRVINARLHGVKDTGGSVELLVERIEAERVALCQARSSKPLRPGRTVNVSGWRLGVVGREGEFFRLEFPVPVSGFLERFGETPLPPYIERARGRRASRRSQTVYAARPGAVAAPTAGLHFSEGLFRRLAERGVEVSTITLHVGAGTFQPVRTEDIARHRMHAERYEISAETAASIYACKQVGGRVVAVGTTVIRALETAAASPGGIGAGAGETRLFITPGYRFLAVDALLTNFHLPESTLLMLVCAFAGHDRVMSAYSEAIAARYRFFSYGDAMFCERAASV